MDEKEEEENEEEEDKKKSRIRETKHLLTDADSVPMP